MNMTKRIVIIAEFDQGAVRPVTMELMTAALELKHYGPAVISICIAGRSIQSAAEMIAEHTGCPVQGLEMDESAGYFEEQFLAAVTNEIELDPPDLIFIAHTTRGLSLAGTLAAKLKAACITGVEKVITVDEGPGFERPVSGGKFTATVASDSKTTILTVQPGAYEPYKPDGGNRKQIGIRTAAACREQIKVLDQRPAITGAADLASAGVIVAAGQGIGGPEKLDLINGLASCFSNSAVAGTRIVCDLGWLEYNRQVGISGNTVAPDLYIACGISGAMQHLMGMRGSKFVVAVNSDPNAAIFREADVCIAEDLNAFIPAFIDALEKSG